jgi:hypothetical protein
MIHALKGQRKNFIFEATVKANSLFSGPSGAQGRKLTTASGYVQLLMFHSRRSKWSTRR